MSAKKATSADGQFTRWMLGVIAAIIPIGAVTNGSILWKLNSDVVALGGKHDNLSAEIVSLRGRMEERTTDRYTATQASSDRDMLLKLINANAEKNSRQEEQINALREFQIRLEAERSKR